MSDANTYRPPLVCKACWADGEPCDVCHGTGVRDFKPMTPEVLERLREMIRRA